MPLLLAAIFPPVRDAATEMYASVSVPPSSARRGALAAARMANSETVEVGRRGYTSCN